jgi:hypothetical protein
MSIQPIDVPAFLHAVAWPAMATIVLAIFRQPLRSAISALGRNVSKLSVGKFSIEMAQVQEMKPRAMDTEIRQLDASLLPQSGSTGLTALVNELRSGGKHDYVVIDFGSETSPRWLTSRLYLLCFLLTLIDRQLCLVFVETIGSVRKKFIGTAPPNRVRWSFARKYGWLESAVAGAYAMQVANPPTGFAPSPTPSNQFDPDTGFLGTMIPNLIQQFLTLIRSSAVPPDQEKPDWVSLGKQQTYEHAKWLEGPRIESLVGNDLSRAHVTLPPNGTLSSLVDPVLAQRGRFIAVVEPDGAFLCLVDRQEVLDTVAKDLLETRSARS